MDPFNSENPGEILNNIREIIHCPFCGSNYNQKNIKIVGRVSKNYIMHLLCKECGNHIMASLTYQGNAINPFPQDEVFELVKKGPISNNEVMDFIKNIKDFDGDFKSLFRDKRLKK